MTFSEALNYVKSVFYDDTFISSSLKICADMIIGQQKLYQSGLLTELCFSFSIAGWWKLCELWRIRYVIVPRIVSKSWRFRYHFETVTCYILHLCFKSWSDKSRRLYYHFGTMSCDILHLYFKSWSDLTIHKLFATRADLHRTVYTHAKVKVWSTPTMLYLGTSKVYHMEGLSSVSVWTQIFLRR